MQFPVTMAKRWPVISVKLQPMVGVLTHQVPMWLALMMLLSWTFFVSSAGACIICFPYPKTTLADNLLKSKTVIMARERTDKPYAFYAIEVLMGAIDGRDINAFIDTTARQSASWIVEWQLLMKIVLPCSSE